MSTLINTQQIAFMNSLFWVLVLVAVRVSRKVAAKRVTGVFARLTTMEGRIHGH